MDIENFSISIADGYKEQLCRVYGRDIIEGQYRAVIKWLVEHAQHKNGLNYEQDNEYLKVLIENAFNDGRKNGWIHSHLIPIAVLELGYRVREMRKGRPFPVYIFDIKIREEAGENIV